MRIDSQTGEKIYDGFLFHDTFYIGCEQRAKDYAFNEYGKTLEQSYEDGDHYYTTWEDDDDDDAPTFDHIEFSNLDNMLSW